MIFTRDFVTRENYWQIASLMTQKSLFTVTHALFFISELLMVRLSMHIYVTWPHEIEMSTKRNHFTLSLYTGTKEVTHRIAIVTPHNTNAAQLTLMTRIDWMQFTLMTEIDPVQLVYIQPMGWYKRDAALHNCSPGYFGIFRGAPLKVNGAPLNIWGYMTGLALLLTQWSSVSFTQLVRMQIRTSVILTYTTCICEDHRLMG